MHDGVTMSRFYLSHIRGADDEWAATLFRDLSAAVAARTGIPPEAVGVRGMSGPPEMLLERMRDATALVALYAPGYFSQSYCAAEWSYFEQRGEVLWSRTGSTADAVVPVLWAPSGESLPAAVRRHVPLTADSVAYARDGLQHLLRLKARYAQDYRQVVATLADRVVATFGQRLPDITGFDAAGNRLAPSSPASHRRVSFVMAAAAADELPEERTATEFYGPSAVDWSPYAPGRPGVLASLLCDTAAALDLAPAVLALDESTLDRVGDDSRAEELVVLLVDAWAAKLHGKQELLASLDAAVPDTTAVLEPRSREDVQSAQYTEVLDAVLDRALPSLRRHATELDRWNLPDVEVFTSALRKALVRAQNDAMKSSRAGRSLPAPPGGPASFPLLGRSSS
jgi:FxsC-like protein